MTRRRVRRVRKASEPEVTEEQPVVEEQEEEEPTISRRRTRSPRTFAAPPEQEQEPEPEPEVEDEEEERQVSPTARKRRRKALAQLDAAINEVGKDSPTKVIRHRTQPLTEEEKEKPASRRRTRRVIEEPEPEVEETFTELDDERAGVSEPEPEPEPEPVEEPAPKRQKKVIEEPVVEDEDDDWDDEDEAEEASLPVQVTENELANAILAVLGVGKSINVMQVGNRIVVSEGAEVTQVTKRTPNAMTQGEMLALAYDPKYVEFQEWWPKLTWEEKVWECEKQGVQWERHDVAQVDNIRATVAYRKKMKIRKWKPPYKSGKARDELWKKGIRAE